MKKLFQIILLLLITTYLSAQSDTVLSDVYKWNNLKLKNEKNQILKGNTTDIEDFTVDALIVNPGKLFNEKNNRETLIIIKEGESEIRIKNGKKLLSPGSIAYIMPNQEYQIENSGKKDAVFYTLLFEAKNHVDNGESLEAKSFLIDWNDLEFKPHDKGGIRQYFEKPTAMFERFEMHVTTLNAGIKSHEPHTHRAEEIVLMIDGNAELQIGDEFKKANKGDLIFLGANIPHALRNIGNKSCIYFAFQWE